MAAVDCTTSRTPYQGTLSGTTTRVREFTLPPYAWGAVVDASGSTPAALRVSVDQGLTDDVSTLTAASTHVPVPSGGARSVFLGPPTNSTRRKIFVASDTASATVIVTPGGPELAQS